MLAAREAGRSCGSSDGNTRLPAYIPDWPAGLLGSRPALRLKRTPAPLPLPACSARARNQSSHNASLIRSPRALALGSLNSVSEQERPAVWLRAARLPPAYFVEPTHLVKPKVQRPLKVAQGRPHHENHLRSLVVLEHPQQRQRGPHRLRQVAPRGHAPAGGQRQLDIRVAQAGGVG